jgi:hypothetical protein
MGVGNIALGEITPERQRVMSIDEFVNILSHLEAGGQAQTDQEEQVLDAAQNGTSLGGTKPKLTVSRGRRALPCKISGAERFPLAAAYRVRNAEAGRRLRYPCLQGSRGMAAFRRPCRAAGTPLR